MIRVRLGAQKVSQMGKMVKVATWSLCAFFGLACTNPVVVVDAGPMASPSNPSDQGGNNAVPSDGVWGIAVETIEGRATTMGEFAGQAILIVNTASRCGYTGQFDGLQRLHERFKDRGLAIIGFPCNQFMNQDPGSDKDIADFCRVNYGVTFQMMSKIEVNGENRHPLYTFLTEESPEAMRGDIGWNFEKFLLRPDGVPVGRFASRVEPEDERIVSAIEAALPR
jgi:glutathione peroxidase